MFFVYILKSKKNGAYYIGYTSSIKRRLAQHNSDTVLSTKNKGPWEVFHSEIFDDEASAIRRERQLKSCKSRKAIERLKFCIKIEDPRFRQVLSESGPQVNV
jgi:putative endonuclease